MISKKITLSALFVCVLLSYIFNWFTFGVASAVGLLAFHAGCFIGGYLQFNQLAKKFGPKGAVDLLSDGPEVETVEFKVEDQEDLEKMLKQLTSRIEQHVKDHQGKNKD